MYAFHHTHRLLSEEKSTNLRPFRQKRHNMQRAEGKGGQEVGDGFYKNAKAKAAAPAALRPCPKKCPAAAPGDGLALAAAADDADVAEPVQKQKTKKLGKEISFLFIHF